MIKSDRWIREQCTAPGYLLTNRQNGLQTLSRYPIDNDVYLSKAIDANAAFEFGWRPMIQDFEDSQVRQLDGERVISYGLSSYGYDVRAADEWEIFTNINSSVVDPKNFDPKCLQTIRADSILIPPNSFALARTKEYMRIPRDVLTICLGKSTFARCGIIVNVTPLEPEWEGHVTLEFSNTTPLPARVYANEGVAQFLFLQSDEPCEVSYKDRNGKYQGQTGVTRPRS